MLAVGAPGLDAQLPQASAAALGLGFNNTASARSFAAVSANPAGLGHPGSAGFSLALVPVGAQAGFGPIGLDDLAAYEGQVVPDEVKSEWLDRAVAAGGQTAASRASATPLAFTVGSFGFQLSSVVAMSGNLNDDAVELMLFGNAGLTGEPRDFDLGGSTLDGAALTTAAVAFGTGVAPGIWVGATGKYIIGHGVLIARDGGSSLSADPLEARVDFPALFPRGEDVDYSLEFPFENGSGLGLDIGVLVERGGLTLGATIQNLVNTFEWKLEGLSYVPGQALVDIDGGTDDFEERPAAEAPAELLAELDELTLKPVYSIGAELQTSSVLRLSADVRKRTSGGIELGPDFHAGVGAELSVLPFLPLRGHAAVVSGGFQVGGGASLVLGPVNLSGGVAMYSHDEADRVLGAFTLSFGAN